MSAVTKMSAFKVVSSVFIVLIFSGFCIDAAPAVSGDTAPTPATALGKDKPQIQPNASDSAASEKDGKSKQSTDDSSKTAAQQLTSKDNVSNPTSKNGSAPSAASSSNGASDPNQTKTVSPVDEVKSDAISKTKVDTLVQNIPIAAETKTANESASSKSMDTSKAANTSGQTTVVGDAKAGKDDKSSAIAGNNSPKIKAQDAEKRTNADAKAPSTTEVKKADKEGEDVESVGQAPAPKVGGNAEDSDKGSSKNVKEGLGLEENNDGPEDVEESEKPPKDTKPGKADQGMNRMESVVAPEETPPKMRYDDEPENSHFLAYLLTIGVLCVAAYVVAHNRHKIMGLILEGRQGRRSGRSGSTSGRGVKYKRLQHEDAEGENGVSLSSRDGGRVIY